MDLLVASLVVPMVVAMSCSAPGPRKLPEAWKPVSISSISSTGSGGDSSMPDRISTALRSSTARYRLSDSLHRFYPRILTTQLTFEWIHDERLDFRLESPGLLENGDLRIRQYEGRVYGNAQDPSTLLLRTERCYEYMIRNPGSGKIPLQRWDCSHHFYHLEFSSEGSLLVTLPPDSPLLSGDEQTESEATTEKKPDHTMLPRVSLIRMDTIARATPASFAGQIVARTKSGGFVVYGARAGSLLANGQRVYVYSDRGEQKATMIVEKRLEDTVVCRLEQGGAAVAAHRGDIVIARERPNKGGLFD